MADENETKTAEELKAESEQLQAEIAKHKANAAEENQRLRDELAALKRQAEKKKVCPGCGSDQHDHCRLPAHLGGGSEARDSANRAQ